MKAGRLDFKRKIEIHPFLPDNLKHLPNRQVRPCLFRLPLSRATILRAG